MEVVVPRVALIVVHHQVAIPEVAQVIDMKKKKSKKAKNSIIKVNDLHKLIRKEMPPATKIKEGNKKKKLTNRAKQKREIAKDSVELTDLC